MRIKNIITDVLGVVALFITGYAMLFIGYGMGW